MPGILRMSSALGGLSASGSIFDFSGSRDVSGSQGGCGGIFLPHSPHTLPSGSSYTWPHSHFSFSSQVVQYCWVSRFIGVSQRLQARFMFMFGSSLSVDEFTLLEPVRVNRFSDFFFFSRS